MVNLIANKQARDASAHCPRSAAVSKTSRSSFARPAGWNMPVATELFNVLRLVLCTQPRSNNSARAKSILKARLGFLL